MHRYRIAFLSGLAAGFILGARAGRERYEQIKKLARRTADSPAVQQAAGALQAQATGMLKSATHKVANEVHGRVPWLGDGVRHKIADHIPGQRGTDASASKGGAESGQEAAGRRPFAATSERGNGRSAS
jgi:hypothetical protein